MALDDRGHLSGLRSSACICFHKTHPDDGRRANLLADDHRGRTGTSDSQSRSGSSPNINARQPMSVLGPIAQVCDYLDFLSARDLRDRPRLVVVRTKVEDGGTGGAIRRDASIAGESCPTAIAIDQK